VILEPGRYSKIMFYLHNPLRFKELELKITLIQMNVSDGDVKSNISSGIIKAKKVAPHTDLIVLPELWTTGYDIKAIREYSEVLVSGWTIKTFEYIANEYDVHILSSIPLKDGGKLYDSAILIGPKGIIGVYRKIHLFRPYGEDKIFSRGESIGIFSTKLAKLGIAICYDLRFPELFRLMAMDGAEIILIPASWGAPRALQWRTLLRTRAVENEVFVVGVNRFGKSEITGEEYLGDSGVYDPFGHELVHSEGSEEVITVDINLDLIKKARDTLPLWRDRRTDKYGVWSVWGIKD